jgi:16S rRNA processing protein RimM
VVGRVWLRRGQARAEAYPVAAWREHQGRVLLTLEGVADRNAAEALRSMEVCVRREDMPDPGEGELYLHDILGFTVRLEDGTPLGPFARFIETPGGEVWVVEHPDGEILLPGVDEVVVGIDVEAESITVDPPEGLLELYLRPGGAGAEQEADAERGAEPDAGQAAR